MKRTTKAQFQEFEKWFRHYMKAWSLSGWTVYFFHDGEPPLQPSNAACVGIRAPLHARTADVCFTLDQEGLGGTPIRRLAKHECAHLVLARMTMLAHDRQTTYNQLTEEDEHLANVLETLLPD